MKDGKDTWSRLGDYFDEMTDLTADSVKDFTKEWAQMWNDDDDRSAADSAIDAMRGSFGVGLRATAKAWVATRELMIDLSE
jgi:hypothetical protein